MKSTIIAATAVAAILSTGAYANNGNGNDVPPGKPFIALEDQILQLSTYVDQEIVRIDGRLADLDAEIARVEVDSIARDQAMAEYVELLVQRVTMTELRLDNAEENIMFIYNTLNFVGEELDRIERQSLDRDLSLYNNIVSVEANLNVLRDRLDAELVNIYSRLTSVEEFSEELEAYALDLYDSIYATTETLRLVTQQVGKLDSILGTSCPSGTSVYDISSSGTVTCRNATDTVTKTQTSTERRECVTSVLGICGDYDWWQVISLSCPYGYEVRSWSVSGTYTLSASSYSTGGGRGRYWRSQKYDASIEGDLTTGAKTATIMTATCEKTFVSTPTAIDSYPDPVYVITYPDGSMVTVGGYGYYGDGNWRRVPVYYPDGSFRFYRWERIGS